jgi:CDP-diacylglycerol--glycerol-3-phosphate 3-phosphatidyltransferase
MTAASWVTAFRLLATAAILPFIYAHTLASYLVATGIFLVAIASDILDGLLARHFNQSTALGATLDALADKIFVYSTLFALMHADAVRAEFVFPFFLRDMLVDGLRNRAYEVAGFFGANIWGKAKFVFQCLSIALALGYCIVGIPQFSAWANVALLLGLIVSLPGLWIIASVVQSHDGRKPADDVARVPAIQQRRFF